MSDELYMRPLCLEDAVYIIEWMNDIEVFKISVSEEKVNSYIKKTIANGDIVFSVFRRSDNNYIGQVGIRDISREHGSGQLITTVKRDYWNNDSEKAANYLEVMITMMLAYAFYEIKLRKIWFTISGYTAERFRYIYEKLGFHEEGCFRQEYLWDGEYLDIVRFAILAREFGINR